MKPPRWSLGRGLDVRRLRWVLGAVFLGLLVPTAVLIQRSYDQLKWEALYQHRTAAEELAARIDARVVALIAAEDARAYAQYSFITVAGDPEAGFLQRSPLSEFPVPADLPGLIGHFQVAADGTLSTPLLPPVGVDPAGYGISVTEFAARLALRDKVRQVLDANRLARSSSLDSPMSAMLGRGRDARQDMIADVFESDAYDTDIVEEVIVTSAKVDGYSAAEKGGSLDRVEDLNLDFQYESRLNAASAPAAAPAPSVAQNRAKRREQTALAEPARIAAVEEDAPARADYVEEATSGDEKKEQPLPQEWEAVLGETSAGKLADALSPTAASPSLVVNTFESELDPFRFAALGENHLVAYRKVWRDGESIVQGALLARTAFVESVFREPFQSTSLSAMSDLIVALDGAVVRGPAVGPAVDGALLYRTRLSEPLGAFELIFTLTRLPTGPGGVVVLWLSVVLGVVLVGGFAALYRLGLGQIALNRQQQDFVAAVSHELKTPLTSIRMYGEMLQAGWADESKKQEYYDFICAESDRLSRLITNVLHLARLTRNDPQFDPKPVAVAELADLMNSKIGSQVERAGFELDVAIDTTDTTDAGGPVRVIADVDCFSQVMINLVDNALKFSRDAACRRIEITARRQDDRVCFSVRDHGPGVADDQMKKIFKLFYRTESELTRETVGTGIGLALVHQLVLAMGGEVDVRNRQPGAEFRVMLQVAD